MITPARPAPAARPEDDPATAWALAARGGDSDAVDHFVRALHRDVIRYVAHLCGDPQAVAGSSSGLAAGAGRAGVIT